MSRKCPVCNKMAVKKNGKLYNVIIGLGSVGSTCRNCGIEIMCGYRNEKDKSIEDNFLIITEETYQEIRKKLHDQI